MSDAPQGEGWWQASDGKWYPPDQATGATPGGGAAGGGGSGQLDLGTSLTYGWNKFVQNIGDWIILWLCFVGLAILGVVLAIVIGGTGAAAGIRFNVVGILVSGLFIGAIQGVLYVVLAKAAIAVTRGERPEVGKAFALTGNNIVAGIIFGLILGLLNYFCFVFGIVAWLLLGFLPIVSADRDAGAEAVGETVQFQTSRFGETALLLIVAWAIATLTCGLLVPVSEVALAHGYKTMRGEPVAP